MNRRGVAVAAALALVACKGSSHGERTATAEGPPLLLPDAMKTPSPPVDAQFMDVAGRPQRIEGKACDLNLVSVTRGAVRVNDAALETGDVAAVRGDVTLGGTGQVVFARAHLSPCDAARWQPGQTVVKGSAAPDLSFMGGAMHAHLDVDDRAIAPTLYLGRLSGTAGVPEHDHGTSWELLCAVLASGTFSLAGQSSHLGPGTCVSVPPATKHSWKPDPGSTLEAVQMYSPAGPEQRFKKLAADDASRDR